MNSENSNFGGPENHPDPPILAFFDFLTFFSFLAFFLAIFVCFCLLFLGFEGFGRKRSPFFFGGSLLFLAKQGKDWRIRATQTFSGQISWRTLQVMDARTINHERPHQKACCHAAPVLGSNFLTPGHPGVLGVRRRGGVRKGCRCNSSLPSQ